MKRLIAILALAAAPVAAAQTIDENWIVERVVAGKFDELRAVEAESGRGSPVAMFWWGIFLDHCLYGPCEPAAARVLWAKAAALGNTDARLSLMAEVQSAKELDALLARSGGPLSYEERLVQAFLLVRLSMTPAGRDPTAWDKARGALEGLQAAEPRMSVIYAVGALEGFRDRAGALRAMVEAGYSRASEQYRRVLLLTERSSYRELLARAQSGDLVVGAALCDTAGISEGFEHLPEELLPICERALMQGHPGVAPVLLKHHRAARNARPAAYYAELCAALAPVACAPDLADFHYEKSGNSPQWQLWDVVAASALGMAASEMGKPPELLQRAFSIRVRSQHQERACLARRFDAGLQKFEDEPRCPWRRPVEIPREFLSR